jgi:hypothetical protein
MRLAAECDTMSQVNSPPLDSHQEIFLHVSESAIICTPIALFFQNKRLKLEELKSFYLWSLWVRGWFIRPQDTMYGVFSLEFIIWATHNVNLFITDIPLSVKNGDRYSCQWIAPRIGFSDFTITHTIFLQIFKCATNTYF